MLALLLAAVASTSTVDVAITKHLERQHIVGAAVGVYQNGTPVDIKTFGYRDAAKKLPVDVDTRFEIGSVTKQFTAAAILQLQEQGKLSIDDPLAKYLPSIPHANEVTLRQLLNQTSGYPNYTEMMGADFAGFAALMATPGANEKIVAYVKKPLNFPPGTKWEYSNTNYWLLGNVVATVSGMHWEDYIRAHMFKPAGMTHSGFVSDESSLSNFAIPYWEGPKGHDPAAPAPSMDESWPGGAGAIVSTIGDLAAWDAALTSGKIVNQNSYVLMTTPGKLADGKSTNYGMGLVAGQHDGHARVAHEGGTVGSLAENAIYPNDHLTIVVLENDVSGNPVSIESAVVDAMYPDALAAARAPAAGEDATMRPRVLHYLNETLHGSLEPAELEPDFAKIATPERQQQMAAGFAPLGAPTAVIFKGKSVQDGTTTYRYRVEFSNDVYNFVIVFDDATHKVAGLTIRPAD